MNEYLGGDELGALRHAVDVISPDVDGLVAGGLSRGRQLRKRAATRKRMVTLGGPTLAAAAVVGAVLLTSALNGADRGAANPGAAPGGSGSSLATAGQPAPTTRSVTQVSTTKSVTSDPTTVAAQPIPPTTVAAQPIPPTTVAAQPIPPTTVPAQPNAPIDTHGLPSPSSPAAVGAVVALKDLLPADGSVIDPRVFPKDALALVATYTRSGRSAQVTVAVFTAHQAGGQSMCVSGSRCVITILPDGSRQLVTTYSSQHWEVMVNRTNGTLLTVSAVQAGDVGMPLTKAQLIELAHSDRWTHLGN